MIENWSEPVYTPAAGYDPAPESEEEWRAVYDFREDAYLLRVYSAATQKIEHLFRAFDDSGNEIEQTRRLYRHYAFITDTDAAALATGLTLETYGTGTASLLPRGEAVWHRSRMDASLDLWSSETCKLGDWWLEAMRRADGRVVVVGYDPRVVTAVYDAETGTELESVTIDFDHLPGPQMAARNGAAPDEAATSYRRVVTRETVTVTRNGTLSEKESGPHGLSVVPMVHLRAKPLIQPEHSLSAPEGIARLLMRADALVTQNAAIANRYGNPTLVARGFKVGAEGAAKVGRFGRMFDGVPKDGALEYVSVGEGVLPHLLEQQRDILKHIEQTAPEFVFASDAPQESGTARNMRVRSFALKMERMRRGFYRALSEVTAMAVSMERGGPAYDPDACPFKIDAPPVVPANLSEELTNLALVKPDIKRADYVRHLQRLGVVDTDEDPETYASEVADETAVRATQFFADGANGGGAGGPEGADGGATPGANGGGADGGAAAGGAA